MKNQVILLVLLITLFAPLSASAQRPSMAVLDFDNRTSAGWWYGGVGRELSGMLTNELAATRSFDMVERNKLNAVLDEQDLAASGRIAPGSGAKIGKMVGAQYLVTATVSAYEEGVKGTGGGVRFRGVSVGGKKGQAYIAVDLRVIDSTTGRIAETRTVEARSGSRGVNVGLYKGGFGGRLANESKTPTGKAIRAIIVEISDYLECAMVTKGGCMAEFDAKEDKRRAGLKKGIKLDR